MARCHRLFPLNAQPAARNCNKYAFLSPRTPTVLKLTLLACCVIKKADRVIVINFLNHLCETYKIASPKAIYAHDRDKTIRYELVKFNIRTCKNDIKDELLNKDAKLLKKILSIKTIGRERFKALYYEDILLIIIHYSVTSEDVYIIAVKFIYYKGADNKLKPIIINNGAFNALSLTNVKAIFEVKNASLPKDFRRNAANEANNALIEMLTHISVMRDPRAGRDIVPDELKQWREKLKKIRDLINEIKSKKA
ncbi:hypothetical protein QBC46DRAFT_361544 [Diplogelasinospora grovesii]|uniref:Uncharacterized protein n=1 Tax=Diplogelasinospora grovesii TaxID=303347 RepID=A0AAN6S7C1_9PEZI|nr:hypothetical protein QBC46DRAFT_361544 [Diplogelasinospora grovesii]